MQAKSHSDDHEHILFDAALEVFEPAYFEPDYWVTHGSLERVGAGRGRCWFVDGELGAWVLRHYRRGGKAALLSADRYVYLGLARTRAFREWHLLCDLVNQGLPAPAPVAARVRVDGPTYRAALITRTIADTQTLAECLSTDVNLTPILGEVGRCIRQFHDAGVWHADLNAHNVLVDSAGKAYLIDFDRSKRRAGQSWKHQNLSRLRRSLDKLSTAHASEPFSSATWQTLLDAYS
ncbi:MAG: 3-deoxy-D-manno-octulosonic acid kinase [Gammaproteobacteria bacterium]